MRAIPYPKTGPAVGLGRACNGSGPYAGSPARQAGERLAADAQRPRRVWHGLPAREHAGQGSAILIQTPNPSERFRRCATSSADRRLRVASFRLHATLSYTPIRRGVPKGRWKVATGGVSPPSADERNPWRVRGKGSRPAGAKEDAGGSLRECHSRASRSEAEVRSPSGRNGKRMDEGPGKRSSIHRSRPEGRRPWPGEVVGGGEG